MPEIAFSKTSECSLGSDAFLIYNISVVFIISFLFFSSITLAHEAPVNIGSRDPIHCGQTSHAGMGSIYQNEFVAEIKLRKQCYDKATDLQLQKFCAGIVESGVRTDHLTFNKTNLPLIGSVLYFRNYTADVLLSEIELSGGNPNPVPDCLKGFIGKRTRPQKYARQSAMEAQNLVSAMLLMDIYDGFHGIREYEPYTQRLTESFPILFQPKDRSKKLKQHLKWGLGGYYEFASRDGRDHSDMMSAFNTIYQNNDEFRNELRDIIGEIKKSYASDLKKDLQDLCTATPIEIQNKHPGIFKQGILDMNENERAAINNYLCEQPAYYNPKRYDGDCDGYTDDEDPSPKDPFTPRGDFSRSGREMSDPPFSSEFDYKAKKQGELTTLSTKLKFDVSKLSKDEVKNLKDRLSRCNQELEEQMNEAFGALSSEDESYFGKLKTDIDIEFDDYIFPAFEIHSCYCADCIRRVKDPDAGVLKHVKYIDHSLCYSDLSAAQKEAVNKELGRFRWRDRQNAANLTTDVSCKTYKHEVLHRFGLPDEYSDSHSYPYNRVACNIMGDGGTHKIEPRHIQTILSPGECN